MMFKVFIACAIIIINAALTICDEQQLFDGDACTFDDGTNGVCKRLENCEPVKKNFRSGEMKTKRCAFDGMIEIVCCSGVKLIPDIPPKIQTLSNEVIGKDAIIFPDLLNRLHIQLKSSTMNIYEADMLTNQQSTTPAYEDEIQTEKPLTTTTYSYKNEEQITQSSTSDSYNGEEAIIPTPQLSPVDAIMSSLEHLSVIACEQQGIDIPGFNLTNFDQLPQTVSLAYVNDAGNETSFWCSGAVMSENVVVAPASCMISQPAFVRVRGVSPQDVFDRTKPMDIKIKEIMKHPDYSGNLHNIAMIKLESPILSSTRIRPICLVSKLNILPNDFSLIISGYGSTPVGVVQQLLVLHETKAKTGPVTCSATLSDLVEKQTCEIFVNA